MSLRRLGHAGTCSEGRQGSGSSHGLQRGNLRLGEVCAWGDAAELS
ncbi:hypothetical protein IG631_08219 [Alternaria alternata]|nr:hypothetical protein IG631_08219 [Alternaria alternata]